MRRLHRRRVAVAISAVVVAALVAGAVALTYSPLFGARTIRVRGIHHLTASGVIAEAGLSSQTNVFHLDAGAVRSALLSDPWIAGVTVTRSLPTTLIVTVQERTAVAAAEGSAVAGDGVVLPGGDLAGLPVIRASVGALGAADRSGAAAAIQSLSAPVRRTLTVVVVDQQGALQLRLSGGLVVTWGRPSQNEVKASTLDSLLRWARQQGSALLTVDVSAPTAPAGRLVDGSTLVPAG